MVGARSQKWIEDQIVTGETVVHHLQRARDEAGIFHVEMTADSGLDSSIQLRGRPDDSASWFVVHKFVETNLDSGGRAAAVVTLYPQMSMNINKLNGVNPTASAWLIQ